MDQSPPVCSLGDFVRTCHRRPPAGKRGALLLSETASAGLTEINGLEEALSRYRLKDSRLRDRVVRTRPRQRLNVLHAETCILHLWHPRPESPDEVSHAYYRETRPVRRFAGLDAPA